MEKFNLILHITVDVLWLLKQQIKQDMDFTILI